MARYCEIPLNKVGYRVSQLMVNRGGIDRLTSCLGKSRNTVYEKLNNNVCFNQNDIIAICKEYKVTADWLLFGKEAREEK